MLKKKKKYTLEVGGLVLYFFFFFKRIFILIDINYMLRFGEKTNRVHVHGHGRRVVSCQKKIINTKIIKLR